ncbi:MAG: glutathione S-transferase family protein [bacterium]
MLHLYDFQLSGNAHKVRNMLSILDLDYERIGVDLLAGDQHRVDFKVMNPFARVPVLVDENVVIRDSSAILVYLGRKYGRGRWLPVDALGEARVAEWLATASTDLADGPGRARLIRIFGTSGDLEAASRQAHHVLSIFDAHLANVAYLVGRRPTIADIASYTDLALASDGGIEVDEYRNVLRWFARLESLSGFQRAPLHVGASDHAG